MPLISMAYSLIQQIFIDHVLILFEGVRIHTGDTYRVYNKSDDHKALECIFISVRMKQSSL